MRGPWLTSVFGVVLLVGIPIEFVTGLLSYAAYDPRLGNPPNSAKGIFGLYLFDWVTRPSWLYRVIESTHVFLGLVLVPVVLAKLWSVMPKLFEWPPWRSVAQFLERVSLVLVVGGIVFEMVTGILNIDYFTQINFYSGHFYGAWAFMAGFVVHVGVKFGDMVRALRTRSLRTELRTGLAGTRPETVDSALVAPEPAAPTISRRGVLALVGGTSFAVFVLTAGETIGGGLRRLALFGTHYRSPDSGANHFPVNHTAASAGITASATGPDWRLSLVGTRRVSLSRNQLVGHAAHHRRSAHRLHRGVVDGTALDRRAPRRSRPSGGRRASRSFADTGPRRRVHHPFRLPDLRARLTARSPGQRGGPLARPRVPRPDHRPVRPGHPQPQVDERDRLFGGGLRCAGSSATMAPVPSTWSGW